MTMPIARSAFLTFLLDAKRRTYAAQGDDASVTPLLTGSRQLEYRDGMLFYRDIYFGGAFFAGQETIYCFVKSILTDTKTWANLIDLRGLADLGGLIFVNL